ncbi:MAG: orotidine-5'-phosphate decarboxylase [Acidobacteria bacterium]|nr:orotidine-5'-phosphate decarboxylase [Acidobacteriota bacterium]MCI0724662.1 orotidine-5'-phosphate decarboxylase [Acidobacteriota bacterium]
MSSVCKEFRNRIIVALDVDGSEPALSLVSQLSGRVGLFKLGSQLFSAEGPALVREIVRQGEKVFLDLKFHDIPNTVTKAVLVAAELGVSMLTLHASGGARMMSAAAVALKSLATGANRPMLLGVTVLTSMAEGDLAQVGVMPGVESQVARLARLAQETGLDGVVAAASELIFLRRQLEPGIKIVTPGIRPAGSEVNDQSRIATPAEALRAGADYLVIGRPITASSNPAASLEKILSEL